MKEKNGLLFPTKRDIFCFQKKLLLWYSQNGRVFPWRQQNASPYERIIAELLLQRTKAETIANFLPHFINKYPSWNTLSAASNDELIEILKPIGLWNRRSKTLFSLSQIMNNFNGSYPSTREELERLPGIGQYIASSILLFIYDKPEPLLDVNMQRLLERRFRPRILSDIRYDPYLQELSRRIVKCSRPIDINFAILDFSAILCKIKRPRCVSCPLQKDCNYFQIQNNN